MDELYLASLRCSTLLRSGSNYSNCGQVGRNYVGTALEIRALFACKDPIGRDCSKFVGIARVFRTQLYQVKFNVMKYILIEYNTMI